jgi:penicillin-binding protein 1A
MRIMLSVALALALTAAGATAFVLWRYGRDLPDDGKIVAYHPAAGQRFVPMSAMPARVVHAFLSAENRDFYQDPGIDIPLMARAAAIDVVRYLSNERPIGASTITQQLVKNLLLTDKVSLARKIKEVLLALRIERELSKDRILEIYLNEVYLGCGAHGVADASFQYFDKPVDELTLEEAAFVAGLPKAPSHYDPARFPEAAKERRDWVIDRMAEDGYITPAEAASAKGLPIGANPRLSCGAVPRPTEAPPPTGPSAESRGTLLTRSVGFAAAPKSGARSSR